MKASRLWQMGDAALLAGRFGAAVREAQMMLTRAKHATSETMREFYLKDARQLGKEARSYWQELQKLEVSRS